MNTMSNEHLLTKEKYDTLDRLLEEEYVLVHLRSETPGLVIPPHLLENPTVTLKLSRFFRGGIDLRPDMVVTDLLFKQHYFTCLIPFTAIWAVSSVKGSTIVWDSEAKPTEIVPQPLPTPVPAIDRSVAAEPVGTPESPPPPRRSKKSSPSSRPHLRRVK
jgi:hypothetical protein